MLLRLYFMAALLYFADPGYAKKMDMQDIKEAITPIVKNCFKKNKAPESAIEEIRALRFPEDQNVKCAIKCIFNTLRIMDKDGQMNTADIENELIPMLADDVQGTAKELLVECAVSAQPGEDVCETAMNMVKCGIAKHPEAAVI